MSNGSNSQTTRKSHIKRIYKNDDPETGLWIDIERLDELRFVSKARFQWREKVWKFDWNSFDPDGVDIDGNEIPKKLIQSPGDDSDPKDPDASVVQVPLRAVVFVTESIKYQWQGRKHYFINDDSGATRETHSRLVYHHDISEDYLDPDGNPPRDSQDYLKALGDQDEVQYIEVEIIDKYWTNQHEDRDDQGNKKPSAWQETKWPLDSTNDRLLKEPMLQTDTSIPFSPTYNPAAGPKVDPPWRLDPLQNIVNVNWSQYRIVLFRQGLRGAPESIISFMKPKTFFTGSKELPVPVFGSGTAVPTATHSVNRSIPGEFGSMTIITGNALDVAQPYGFPDYRGYTTMAIAQFQGSSAVDSGEKIYFNYKGERVDQIPPMSKTEATRGLPLATDKNGTVYVRSFTFIPGGPKFPRHGITKYSSNGEILWTSNDEPELGIAVPYPLSANYDPKTKLITYVLIDRTIHVWDLDGHEVDLIILPHDILDVSRKGKIYTFGDVGMSAYSPLGKKLWDAIPSSDFAINGATAFGEDFVVTSETGNSSQSSSVVTEGSFPTIIISSTTSTSFENQMGVYDADTGSLIESERWAPGEETVTTAGGPSFFIKRQNFDVGSYNALGFVRSAHFP